MNTIAEVILPLPVKSNFHYRMKAEQQDDALPGKRVLVNFGKSKIYTGLIKQTFSNEDYQKDEKLKYIEEIIDDTPILNQRHLELFDWIAFYYMCTPGEVLKAALPAGLKPESSLRVKMVEDLQWEHLPLDDKEFILMEALTIQPVLDFREVSKIWNILNPSPRLKIMVGRGLIQTYQLVEPRYKPKFKTFLKLNEEYASEDKMREIFDAIRSPNQENLMMRVVEAFFKKKMVPQTETLKELDIASQVVNALEKKGYLEKVDVQIDRIEFFGYKPREKNIVLNEDQQKAFDMIEKAINEESPKPVLLHGITGSGKTHIGKILADAFAIRFIESEAIFATLQKEGITTDENQQRGFDILEKNIEQALSEHKSVCFEITVFTPYSSKLVNNLRNKYAVEKIRVFAPNEVCLSRIRSRQSDRHINILEDKIIEINRLSNAQELDAKLMIINNNLTAADIQTLFSNTFLKSGWGFSPD